MSVKWSAELADGNRRKYFVTGKDKSIGKWKISTSKLIY